jgi:ribosomal protein S21
MKNKCNISVKHNPRKAKGGVQEQNEKLIKIFNKKFKRSGIVQELRKKSYPITRGMKRRAKIAAGRRRAKKNQSSNG